MSEDTYVGAIDQGTTGTRFIVFDHDGVPVARAYREHRQLYPRAGWVEHDPEEIWGNTVAVAAEAIAGASIRPSDLAAVGVTNQRETTVVWDASTGRPLHNAIVWQDRRTADRCAELEADGLVETIRAKTGLAPDPYFSATKLEWLLRNVPGLRGAAEAGDALFGTMQSVGPLELPAPAVDGVDAGGVQEEMRPMRLAVTPTTLLHKHRVVIAF